MKKSSDTVSGNTAVQEPILVAVDAGSGNVAVRFQINDEIQNLIIPARARQGNVQSMALESGTSWETEDENGEPVVFSVVSGGNQLINTCDPNYQISPAHRVLVINALAQMGLGGHDIVLADTLPINQFYSDIGVINHERIQAKCKSLMTPVKNFSGRLGAPRIVGVKVYPEAITAYISASVDANMQPNPMLEGAENIIIVDLGRFTCDIAELDKNHQIIARITTEHGVHMILTRVHALIQENADKLGISEAQEINLESIDTIIRQGYIGSRLKSAEDKRISVVHIVRQAIREHAERISQDIRNIHRNLSDIDVIVFVGGGAIWLGGKLVYLREDFTQSWKAPVYIPENPEFANVRGVHIALQEEGEQLLSELNKEEV